MNGIQKALHLGLLEMARLVKEGRYGIDDVCCEHEPDAEAFLEDLTDNVTSNME